MRGRTILLAGCLLAMLAGPAFAQGDDWVRVPSPPPPRASRNPPASAGVGAPGATSAPAPAPVGQGCEIAGRLAEQTAEARDKGASSESQLEVLDDPDGVFHRIADAARRAGDTAGMVNASFHREVAYVYAHREMTPAQLKAYWEQACANPAAAH